MQDQAEGGPQFRDLREGENPNQNLATKNFILTKWWGQAVQLIIYEAKKGNMEGPALP